MKIFLPIKIKDAGGIHIFARKFQEGMEKRGHQVFFEEGSDFDILFILVRCPWKHIFEAKRRRKKIVHRLDGVYYWSVAGWKYFLYNLKPRLIHQFFSDFTIYQSTYSQYCSEKFLGKKKTGYEIIYNGVDLEKFSLLGKKIEGLRDNPEQKIFFTVSQFRREDQIIPIIEALRIYREKFNSNYKFLVAGEFMSRVRNIPKEYAQEKNMVFLGKIKNDQVALYERSADVFLFTHLNPPCPNNIIEAMACGLPICGINDGAMKELVKNDFLGLLASANGDAFWKKRKYDAKKFANNLDKIVSRKNPDGPSAGRAIVSKAFSLENMVDQYITIFKQLKK